MPWDGVKALIERAKAGDEDAWRALFALAQGHLLRLAQKRIGRGYDRAHVARAMQAQEPH